MRVWNYQMLKYLPNLQFKGQLRELVAIMHDWRDKGGTNHLLINRVMGYSKEELHTYFLIYSNIYYERYGKKLTKYEIEFSEFSNNKAYCGDDLFKGWHNKEYLRICYANLYEKHIYGVGKSRIDDTEWQVLLDGYKKITGENYVI